MRKKIVFLMFFMAFLMLFGINEIEADYCTDCAAGGKDCGLCGRSCEINDEGQCVISSHYEEIFDEESDQNQETQSNQDTDKGSDKETELGNKIKKVYCGKKEEGGITGIPRKIPELTSYAVTLIQIAIPIVLVIIGSLDLFKGITAGKEDEMKKGQQMFIKRLAVAAIIFFVVIIVKFFISIVADTNLSNIVDCIDCFVSNDCKEM